MSTWYFDDSADLAQLDGVTVAIIGYGNQGRAQALNMRDSGLKVIVGSRRDASYDQAVADGFAVYSYAEAVTRAQVHFLLVPDEVMPALYAADVAPHLAPGDALVFASGYNITFEEIVPPSTVDVLMIAPRMIGQGVRDHFLSGESFPSLIGIAQDATGTALARTLALSKAIGSTRMGVILSSFEEETLVDLFSEQIGGLYAVRRHFEALVEAGCSPDVVLLELYASGEGIATQRAYRDLGLWAQITLHSRTSQYGQEVTSRLDPAAQAAERERYRRVIENIRNGTFAAQWKAEREAGFPEFDRVRQENLAHPLVQAERALYRRLGRASTGAASAERAEDGPRLTDDQMRARLALPSGRVRVLIDTDTHNEIDDQFALAWALLSQDQLEIEGVVAEPYSFAHHRRPMLAAYEQLKRDPSADVGSQFYGSWARRMLRQDLDPYSVPFVDTAEGMELSYQEILTVFDKLQIDPADRVRRGSPRYMERLDAPLRTPAAELIIERALADDERPLYVVAIGCVTNIASALLLAPEIAEKIVVVWTSAYPSTSTRSNLPSLNLVQDLVAARHLFDCGVPHVYLPGFHVGAQLITTLPEMERYVKGRGQIGDYLYHLYTHNPIHAQRGITEQYGRSWVMWDLINFAWLLNPDWVSTELCRTPILDDTLHWRHDPSRHLMREAYAVNRDAIFRDLFRKLERAP